jgi:hypothetical protein
MLNWISQLTPEGKLDRAMLKAEEALKSLGIEWFAADHETKLAYGQFGLVRGSIRAAARLAALPTSGRGFSHIWPRLPRRCWR